MGIVVENVSRFYKGKAFLKDISFEINDGDFVTLLGETGSGKTTLLRILAGIEKPDRGRVIIDGKDVVGVPVQQRQVAMVYQQFINYPSMTVYENIASPLRVSKKKFSTGEIDRKVREVADLLTISHVLDHYPEEVSGGQQQRTAIARALVKETSLILLDEPLANLDYKLREELRGELKRIFQKRKGVIVYATPEPVDALSMGTHVGLMYQGELMQYGPMLEVYENPDTVEVGEYFSHPTMNICECLLEKENDTVRLVAKGGLVVDVSDLGLNLVAREYLLGIHAHAVSTRKENDRMFPIRMTVDLAEVVGSDTELHVSNGELNMVVLMQDVVAYEMGAEIDIYVDPRRMYIFDRNCRRLVAKTFEVHNDSRKEQWQA